MTPSIRTIADFYIGAERYVSLFDAFCKKHGIEKIVQADHLCYKCNSKESFEFMRSLFEPESQYVYQSFISNRRIAYIKLKKSFDTIAGPIAFVELSDQKPNGLQKEGFDHIEAYPHAGSYEDMVKNLERSETVVKVERPHHTTHDIDMGNGFLFRCTEEPLIEKIKRSEMR